MSASISPFAASASGSLPAAWTESTSASDSSDSSSSSTGSSATVTANDFLQLLVTEMKNQDPTANTDPNEYITQLVQVNSLEQLVQINQTLGSGSTTSTSTSGSFQTPDANSAPGASSQNTSTSVPDPAQTGNLALPASSAAAAQVAHALAPSAAGSSSIRTPQPHAGSLRSLTFNTAQ